MSAGLTRRSMVDCILNGVGEAPKSLTSRFSARGDSSSNSIGEETIDRLGGKNIENGLRFQLSGNKICLNVDEILNFLWDLNRVLND